VARELLRNHLSNDIITRLFLRAIWDRIDYYIGNTDNVIRMLRGMYLYQAKQIAEHRRWLDEFLDEVYSILYNVAWK